MFKLMNMTSVIPKSLFLTQVERETDLCATAMGGKFATVFTGKYAGQLVALRTLNLSRHQEVRGTPSTTS